MNCGRFSKAWWQLACWPVAAHGHMNGRGPQACAVGGMSGAKDKRYTATTHYRDTYSSIPCRDTYSCVGETALFVVQEIRTEALRAEDGLGIKPLRDFFVVSA